MKPQGHMQLGKGQCSFRAKTEGFADARALVQLWIDTAPSIELGESQMSLAGVADTILEAMIGFRRCSVGTAGPMCWVTQGAVPGTPRTAAPGTPKLHRERQRCTRKA